MDVPAHTNTVNGRSSLSSPFRTHRCRHHTFHTLLSTTDVCLLASFGEERNQETSNPRTLASSIAACLRTKNTEALPHLRRNTSAGGSNPDCRFQFLRIPSLSVIANCFSCCFLQISRYLPNNTKFGQQRTQSTHSKLCVLPAGPSGRLCAGFLSCLVLAASNGTRPEN